MTVLNEARGFDPIAPIDPEGISYGVKRTGNVPHVTLEAGTEVDLVAGAEVLTKTGSVTKTETGSLTKTETGSVTKTETGSKTTTETGSVTKTESGSKTTTETGSVVKTETGSLVKTETGSLTKTETGSVIKTEQGSLVTIANNTGVLAGVSSTNRLLVEATLISPSAAIPINIKYDKSLVAINANEWQEVATYIVPAGYKFTCSSFRAYSAQAGETAKVYLETVAATYNPVTNTFTDGVALTAPRFGSGVYIYVTAPTGNAIDTVTITYTNELGITGRTCTIIVPKNSLIGTSVQGVLEGMDIGIRDITNITHNAPGNAGAYKVDIYQNVFNLLLTSSNTQYQAVSVGGNPITFPAGAELVLAVLAATKTAYVRHLSMVGTLEPA